MAENVSGYVVHPTGPNGEHHTDIAKTGLFSACISVINSERQAIWQRYNSMLVANAVVLGAHQILPPRTLDNIISSIMGLILCGLWLLLTLDGWKFYDIYCKQAAKFSWPSIDKDANIISCQYSEYTKVRGDRIKTIALSIIGLFVIGHIFLLISFILGD